MARRPRPAVPAESKVLPKDEDLLAFKDITERRQSEEMVRRSNEQLQSQLEELTRFNRVAVGRELRMIELKREVNELTLKAGKDAPYRIEFEHDENDAGSQ